MPGVIDHLVVRAPDLTTGEAYVQERIGGRLVPGGRHELMGTHNALGGLRIGGASAYLEVIARDPQATEPARPRWFGLDDPGLDNPAQSACLASWVIRVDDPEALDLAPVLALARDDLSWCITVPDDGGVPHDGVGPHLITWDSEPPAPAETLPRCVSIVIEHPDPQPLRDLLDALDLAAPVSVQHGLAPRLVAAFDTPTGGAFLASDEGGLDLSTERQAAMDLFHATWRYLDLSDRSPEHDVAMVACAEASLWHWRRVGAPTQWAIGEWQCSRVRSVLRHAAEALEHARRCLAIAESDRVDDFVPASAHEALARAYAVNGDLVNARAERNISYGLALDLDNDERDIIEHDLGTIPIDDAGAH